LLILSPLPLHWHLLHLLHQFTESLLALSLLPLKMLGAVSAVHFIDVAELRHTYGCVAVAWGRFALAQFCHHLKNVSKDTNDTNVLFALHFN
jgi:hypothetical protein